MVLALPVVGNNKHYLCKVNKTMLTLSSLTHDPRSQLAAILGQHSVGCTRTEKFPAVKVFYFVVFLEAW